MLIQQIRRSLPRAGGNNLWRIIQRFLRLFKLKPIGRDHLAHIVGKYGLNVGRRKSRQIKTTYSGHNYAVQPNLVPDLELTGPNQLLVADITYIPSLEGALYLFLITDAFSRKILGYCLSRTLDHDGAVEALQMALREVPNPKGVVHHSDRGVQYCCHDFLDEIQRWELRSSMTDRDHCAQNALAECMNGILKSEFLLDARFPSFASAKTAVKQAIFAYNHLRLHGKLCGKTPAEVHSGYDRNFDLWATELLSFNMPTPPRTISCVNSI
jgi:putative transposase